MVDIPDSGFSAVTVRGRRAYGALKLKEVRDDTLFVVPSLYTAPEYGQFMGNFDSHLFKGYDEKNPIALEKETLLELRRTGSIDQVRR